MTLKQKIGELIGGYGRVRVRQINGYTPTRDFSTADYRYWDRARRAKAKGLEISGLLLKPLASKAAAWVLGDAPEWSASPHPLAPSPTQAGRGGIMGAPLQGDVGIEALNGWWAAHHPDILRGYEEALNLGDCYLVVNGDLSVTVVPPHVVESMLDGAGVVVGWRITERTDLTPADLRSANPSPLHGEGRKTTTTPPLYGVERRVGGEVTIVDEYTAAGRVRRVMRGSVTVRTERFANLTGVIPVIHVANRWGADEFYGRPEGDALIPALQRYGDVIDAAIRGNIRQGRPTPVIEKMGTAEQVRKFWEKFGRRETQTLPDGSTETVDVIDFDPDQLLTLGGEAQFKYAAPGSFSGDTQTLLSVLFYLVVQHSEIPEAVWGASIPSSRASAETQMQPFVRWIEKKRGLAESWLMALARVALAYLAVTDWRINPEMPLRIGWSPLTEEDGRLRLDTVTWAHGAGVIGDDEARRALPLTPLAPLPRRRGEGKNTQTGQTHGSAPTSWGDGMTKIQLHEAAQTVEDRMRVTLTCISEMRGAYPDIALPGDIDREALATIVGDEAFFVTLPIGQAGAKSRNQRRYSRAAVEQMVAQINQQRPEGMWGHVAADEAQTRYDPPAIRWLAATLDGDGIAWGKGLPLTAETREYYRLAKATNARVGTSLVAWAQMDGSEVTALELVAVDLADPARVGVPVTAAQAVISKEMITTETAEDTEQRQGEPPRRQERQERNDSMQRREEEKKDAKGARHVVPLQAGALMALTEMLGEGDVVARVKAALAEREALRDAVITAAVERAVRVPAAQTVIEELVRARLARQAAAPSREAITAAVAEVVERESVRALLRESLAQAMGPAQRRPVRREGEDGYFSY